MKKIIAVFLAGMLMSVSSLAFADPVTEVWSCTINDGKTAEEVHKAGREWLKVVRKITGNDDIQSSFVSSVVGDAGNFMWVDTYPSLEAWAAAQTAMEDSEEYAPVGAALNELETCSGNRLYRGVSMD